MSKILPAGTYRVLVDDVKLLETRSGTRTMMMRLKVVEPHDYLGRQLFDTVVPLVGEPGEMARAKLEAYGVPKFIVDDYVGGGSLPLGNKAGLLLAASALVGRTADVYVRTEIHPAFGHERNLVATVSRRTAEGRVVA